MLDLDTRGVPGAMVATTAFEEAAAAQSRSLGFDPAIVWVPHPIQDRTDEELRAIADDALVAILSAITTRGSEEPGQ
jgi:alkanesulfonate monooxygenase SsuD/methylene tetrahydromethanopterin reductase-like flavin-dependent oxidoreductase (luciferase family)